MKSILARAFGMRIPLFAFTNSREVTVEVSRAGGMGVFGAVPYSAEELAEHLDWIDAHVGGRPYGVDVVMPASTAVGDGAIDREKLEAMISPAHRRFVEETLRRFEVPPLPEGVRLDVFNIETPSILSAYPQSTVPLEGPRIATLTFTAVSPGLPEIPVWLDGLTDLPGYVDAVPGNVQLADEGGYTVNITMHINADAYSNRMKQEAERAAQIGVDGAEGDEEAEK